MKIEIIGTESLGVRGLSCFVESKNYKIFIDPGISLGYKRYGLLPHPFQVAVGERIQRKIIKRWGEATHIVVSHFHGDHIPLVDANPYQLGIEKIIGLNTGVEILTKDLSTLSDIEKKRVESFPACIKNRLVSVEGKNRKHIDFSESVPHGLSDELSQMVMMTRIEEKDIIFVHASDIQLLNDESISKIILWHPNIVLAAGPPLYLSRLSESQIETAWKNAIELASHTDILILDHHLMRSPQGIDWLKRLSSETGKNVICAADFMKRPCMLLESERKKLYVKIPVAENWHENYADGKTNTNVYWNSGKKMYGEGFAV
jgi:uncharacterized protein